MAVSDDEKEWRIRSGWPSETVAFLLRRLDEERSRANELAKRMEKP